MTSPQDRHSGSGRDEEFDNSPIRDEPAEAAREAVESAEASPRNRVQASLLVRICLRAERDFKLRVAECNAPGAPARWGPVHRVHSPNSFHYRGRAADISGSERNMRNFCGWVSRTHGPRVAELIHNPGCSIDNGKRVPASFWGSAWQGHRNHVHLAI